MQLIASCSEDCTVKVWGIPEDGFTETETEALIDLSGHGRKVTLLRFHPTASNVLARYVSGCSSAGCSSAGCSAGCSSG